MPDAPFAVVCPDKFRGSLNAPEAAAALAAGLRRAGWAEVVEVPLADGGEGTLDALLAARHGRRRTVRVSGPLGEPVDADYGELDDGTAVVEMARASGLALLGPGRNDPLEASTKGTGELIAAVLQRGALQVLVGVGGSATTDGGLGAVEALGWNLRGADVVVACDVRTLFVEAAARFAPQKGASEKQVELLGRRLERLAGLYQERTGVDVTALPGSGAAGGLAGGLAALGARLAPGFDVVATAAGLDEALDGASLMVTGEGKVDAGSLEGKVVGGALEWAAEAGVPDRAVVAGSIDEGVTLPEGVMALSLVERAFDVAESMTRAALLAEEAALEAGRRALRS